MRLNKVTYELFESDVIYLSSLEKSDPHEIDREIRLSFDGEEDVFISWEQTSAFGRIYFMMSFGTQCHFGNEAVSQDYSEHAFWRPLVGAEIQISHVDFLKQAVRISSSSYEVFCYARENSNWGRDVTQITPRRHCVIGGVFQAALLIRSEKVELPSYTCAVCGPADSPEEFTSKAEEFVKGMDHQVVRIFKVVSTGEFLGDEYDDGSIIDSCYDMQPDSPLRFRADVHTSGTDTHKQR